LEYFGHKPLENSKMPIQVIKAIQKRTAGNKLYLKTKIEGPKKEEVRKH